MPDRFKETGYASTRQDAIISYYQDIRYDATKVEATNNAIEYTANNIYNKTFK